MQTLVNIRRPRKILEPPAIPAAGISLAQLHNVSGAVIGGGDLLAVEAGAAKHPNGRILDDSVAGYVDDRHPVSVEW